MNLLILISFFKKIVFDFSTYTKNTPIKNRLQKKRTIYIEKVSKARPMHDGSCPLENQCPTKPSTVFTWQLDSTNRITPNTSVIFYILQVPLF